MPTPANPKADAFIDRADKWADEYRILRAILRDTAMTEDFKWGWPCYTVAGKNVVLIHGFKDYCALLFHKGALLKDPNGILIQQTENVQSARQIRFTNVGDIRQLEPAIRACVAEAITVEQSGRKVAFKPVSEFTIPEEFQTRLNDMQELKTAFEALTPGRQRAYILHFSGAKQSVTRNARVEKAIPNILAGKGMDD